MTHDDLSNDTNQNPNLVEKLDYSVNDLTFNAVEKHDFSVNDLTFDELNTKEPELQDDNDDSSECSEYDILSEYETTAEFNQNNSNDSATDISNVNNFDLFQLDVNLYNGSKVTENEALIIVSEIYFKNKLSQKALNDILQSYDKFLPEGHNMPKSSHSFFKHLQRFAPVYEEKRNYYCKNCLHPPENNLLQKICTYCQKSVGYNYFLEFDFTKQIQFFFEHRNLASKLKKFDEKNPKNNTGLMSGSEYVKVKSQTTRTHFDLTLVLYTDGVNLFNSSESSLYPTVFSIAELPENLKESFLIIADLWLDTEKPIFNFYLKPTCLRLKNTFENGITWKNPQTQEYITSFVVCPKVIADGPVRADLQNILYPTGICACNICEIITTSIEILNKKKEKKKKRVYQFEEKPVLRTSENMKIQGSLAASLKIDHVRGVKGASILEIVPYLERSSCLGPELMHSTGLGSILFFLNIWFVTCNEWSIKEHIAEIDSLMLCIKLPNIFSRLPRSVTLCNKYKAHELLTFGIHISIPLLKNFLPPHLFDHWTLFIYGITTLLKKHISDEDIKNSARSLNLFVKNVKTLYHEKFLTYTIHQIVHLPLFAERWGNLFSSSAFLYEDFNGFLSSMVHGSKNIQPELAKNLNLYNGYKALKDNIRDSEKNSNVMVFDKQCDVLFDDKEINLFKKYNLQLDSLKIYSRSKFKNFIYTSKMYKQLSTNSYTVEVTLKNEKIVYGEIKFFFSHEDENFIMINPFYIETSKMIYTPLKLKIEHTIPVKETDLTMIVKFSEIQYMQHLARVLNYVSRIPYVLLNKNL